MNIDWGIAIVSLLFICMVLATSGLHYWPDRKGNIEKQERSIVSRIELTIFTIAVVLLLVILGWITKTLFG